MPRSMRQSAGSSGSPTMKMLPGCGSAWKKPSSKICCTKMRMARRAMSDPEKPAASASPGFLPAMNSIVMTVFEHAVWNTWGKRQCGLPSKLRAKRRALSASMPKSSSAVTARSN